MAGSSLALRPFWAHGATRCAAARLKLAATTSCAAQHLSTSLVSRPLSSTAVAADTGSCIASRRRYATGPAGEVPVPASALPPPPEPSQQEGSATSSSGTKFYRERLLDGEEEVLTEAEKLEKDKIVKELTQRLSGPLADEHGNVPTGADRPIAIEVDGPSHFYANSKRYTAYTKLKHRLLTRMGYKVLHVPYYEWRRLRGAKEREEYMRAKLLEEPSEWLDPEDEKYYNSPPQEGEEEFSVKAESSSGGSATSAPPTPPPPPGRAMPEGKPPLGQAATPEVSPTGASAPSAPVRHVASTAASPPSPPPLPAPGSPKRPTVPAAPPQFPGQRSGPPRPPPPPMRRPGNEPPVPSGLEKTGQPTGVRRPPPPPPARRAAAATEGTEVLGFPSFPSSK